MRGPAPVLVLVALGLIIACGNCRAQDDNQPAPSGTELQTDSPFAEEIKLLDAAADKAARTAAFDAILKKADDKKLSPEPLVSILTNKKPEAAFKDLLEHLRDTPGARRKQFLQPLILSANDAGDAAKVAVAAVLAYDKEAVPQVCAMLESDVAGERLAAAAVSGERPGGAAGAVECIPKLVKAFDRNEQDLTGIAIRSLKRIALLDLETAPEWKEWLGEKGEFDLLVEIADRTETRLREAEASRDTAQAKLLDVMLRRMRNEERNDAAALIAHLHTADSVTVRKEATTLLRELLKTAKEDQPQQIIDAFGKSLANRTETEEVRKLCAAGLAECGKPELAFPYIDKTLEANGLSADLKLELVKGLNAPIAAARLGRMLESEIDGVESRSGAVLDTLIAQVRSVLKLEDASAEKEQILAQISRLIDLVALKISGELEAPARARYVDLASKSSDTLAYISRQRLVDISPCIPALLNIALTENGAASAGLTAMRQALDVPASRSAVIEQLTKPPASEQLQSHYIKLVSNGDEAMLIKLLGLYESMGRAPEPVEQLRKRLLDRAESTEAVLPATPATRKTLRDALRGLLAVLLKSPEERAALVTALLKAEYGANDALAFMLLMEPPRVAVIIAGMQELVENYPVKIALVVARLHQSLNSSEQNDRDYKAFRIGVNTAVRKAIAARLETALKGAIGDDLKKELTGLASGFLRDQFVPTAVEQLRKNPAVGDSRDTVSEILMAALRQAHPEKYEDIKLKGLAGKEFTDALDTLNNRLKDDGYILP